jgi:hypothetical protein
MEKGFIRVIRENPRPIPLVGLTGSFDRLEPSTARNLQSSTFNFQPSYLQPSQCSHVQTCKRSNAPTFQPSIWKPPDPERSGGFKIDSVSMKDLPVAQAGVIGAQVFETYSAATGVIVYTLYCGEFSPNRWSDLNTLGVVPNSV